MTDNPFSPKMTETQRSETLKRYGRGESLNRIAKDYRIGPAALTRTLKKRGVSTGIAGRTIKESGACKPAQIRRSTGWTKRRFKEELSRLAKRLGRIPTTEERYESGLPSVVSFTYNLKRRLRALHRSLGRPLTSIDIKGEPKSKWRRFVQRFETLEHACEVAGVPFRRLAKRRRFSEKDAA